jgi:hypothetical protein
MRWASLSDSSALARTSPVLNPANRRIRTRMSEGGAVARLPPIPIQRNNVNASEIRPTLPVAPLRGGHGRWRVLSDTRYLASGRARPRTQRPAMKTASRGPRVPRVHRTSNTITSAPMIATASPISATDQSLLNAAASRARPSCPASVPMTAPMAPAIAPMTNDPPL